MLCADDPNTAGKIEFKSWFVAPTFIESSGYDYMHGGYNTHPMRIASEHNFNKIFFTYMQSPLAGGVRRQKFAARDFDGTNESGDFLTKITNITEGFGSIALDRHDVPFYVWHAAYRPAPHVDQQDCHMIYDDWIDIGMPGWGIPDNHQTFLLNPLGHANLAVDPLRHRHIWPTVHIGPSPIAGMERIYVFTHNTRGSIGMPGGNPPDNTIPSSSQKLSYADFDRDLVLSGEPNDFVWTQKVIPYFEQLHTWLPLGEWNRVRAHTSYTVRDNIVLYGGSISGNTEEATLLEEHDVFFVWCDNYGDSYFTNIKTFWLNNVDPIDISHPKGYLEDGTPIEWDHRNEYILFGMENSDLNNKNILIDNKGRFHMPQTYDIRFLPTSGDHPWSRYYWPSAAAETMHHLRWDPAADDLLIYNIHPRGTAITDRIPYVWDLDLDGNIDPELLTDLSKWGTNPNGTLINVPYHGGLVAPFGDEDRGATFHTGHVRLTEVTKEGYIAMMWFDSFKSHRFRVNNDSDYAPFDTVPELMISISPNEGDSWSTPMVMSRLTHTEFKNIPTYVWPADKLFITETAQNGKPLTARLYFMYTDDHFFGPETQGIGPPGADIFFAAMDIDVSDLEWEGNTTDVTVPRVAMLNQNFPNPFNPSTTIQFTMPRAGHVSLNVYNVRGQLVRTLVNENRPEGLQSVQWTGNDNNNRTVASGVYFYKIETDGKSEVKRMVLMK